MHGPRTTYEEHLGAMQPSFGLVYECLSNGSPDDFGTAQILIGPRSLHVLFSLTILMILLAVCCHFVMQGTDVITPGNPTFSRIFFPKIGADASQVSCLGMATVTPARGSCCDSVLTGLEADHPYFCKCILNEIVVLENVCLCQLPISFVKTGCTWLDIWLN